MGHLSATHWKQRRGLLVSTVVTGVEVYLKFPEKRYGYLARAIFTTISIMTPPALEIRRPWDEHFSRNLHHHVEYLHGRGRHLSKLYLLQVPVHFHSDICLSGIYKKYSRLSVPCRQEMSAEVSVHGMK